jgi:hypothetical protein
MSTKMYNFYQYPRNDIFALQIWLQELRLKYQQHVVAEVARFAKRVPKDQLWDKLHADTTIGFRSPFNIDASVAVYLDGIDLYVQFLGVSHMLYRQEVVAGMLIEKEYQNQSDQPDDVSDEEWKARKELVERILDKHDSAMPSKCGFIWALMDHNDCMWVSHQVQKSLNLVAYMLKEDTLVCTECGASGYDYAPIMQIDLEKMENPVCMVCRHVFSYGQWRESKAPTIEEYEAD